MHDWPTDWTGEWLSVSPQQVVGHGLPEFDDDNDGTFARSQFRTSIVVDSPPSTLPFRVTADSRYALFVNGRRIGAGPVRSQARRLHYDEYDLADAVLVGDNTLTILVTYYGRANSFWAPAPGTGNFGRAGIVVAEWILDGRARGTDATWEVRSMPAWADVPRAGMDGVPVESLDARLLPPDWRSGGGDGWGPANPQAVTHLGGMGRTRPPSDPYGPIRPRPIGLPDAVRVAPIGASVSSTPVSLPEGTSPVDDVLAVLPSRGAMEHADPGRVAIVLAAGIGRLVEIDFGRVVAGHLCLDLDAPEGTRLDMLFREKPRIPAAGDFPMSLPRTGARYVAGGDHDRFEALESNGFRLVDLLVTAPVACEVVVGPVVVEERLQTASGGFGFTSSDAELDALYLAGVRTVAVNCPDAYTDCPTREQRAWVGDGVVHQQVTFTTSADWRPATWYVALCNSPRADGLLPMSVAGEVERAGKVTIPDWSLYWIHGVRNLLRYTGDRQALSEAAPTVRRILQWYEPFVDGVVADVPEWCLVDWSSIFTTGQSAILTAMLASALRCYEEISRFLGNEGDAAWAGEYWQGLREGFELFWDEDRGTYVDHAVDGVRQAPASQLAGAWAIVGGLCPPERVDRVIAWIGDPSRQVVRSWIGGDGDYDIAKIAENARGIQRIDWDAEAEVVVAQPFGAHAVHDALLLAGRPDLVVQSMRRWSEFLVDGYDTFGECWGWGTPAHGWSSTPTRDLIQAVAGITPDEPGFTRARIAPAYGVLDRFTATAPTPYGPIRLEVDGDVAQVWSPVPAVLVLPDGTLEQVEPRPGL